MGWAYAFLNMCELESFHESYSSGVFLDKINITTSSKNEKWMNGYALEKWESTLNFVFMPIDTM